MTRSDAAEVCGTIFDVDTFAVHDGPGIRMAVYLKGCPLRCAWCHSPESQSPGAELILLRDRCTGCGACAAACEAGVHAVDAAGHRLARERCRTCGACVEACPADALRLVGRQVRAGEIVEGAARMKVFFDHSGGGVTLTGGEPTAQADFAAAVLAGCREAGIHTAVETAGACDGPTLRRIADLADLVLYDLKLIDGPLHRRWTGAGNEQILANAAHLAGRDVEVRVPLVPGVTDTDENLRAIFAFLGEAGLGRVALLPYNASAAAKYDWLGRTCPLDAEPQDAAHLARLLAMARDAGLDARLG